MDSIAWVCTRASSGYLAVSRKAFAPRSKSDAKGQRGLLFIAASVIGCHVVLSPGRSPLDTHLPKICHAILPCAGNLQRVSSNRIFAGRFTSSENLGRTSSFALLTLQSIIPQRNTPSRTHYHLLNIRCPLFWLLLQPGLTKILACLHIMPPRSPHEQELARIGTRQYPNQLFIYVLGASLHSTLHLTLQIRNIMRGRAASSVSLLDMRRSRGCLCASRMCLGSMQGRENPCVWIRCGVI